MVGELVSPRPLSDGREPSVRPSRVVTRTSETGRLKVPTVRRPRFTSHHRPRRSEGPQRAENTPPACHTLDATPPPPPAGDTREHRRQPPQSDSPKESSRRREKNGVTGPRGLLPRVPLSPITSRSRRHCRHHAFFASSSTSSRSSSWKRSRTARPAALWFAIRGVSPALDTCSSFGTNC